MGLCEALVGLFMATFQMQKLDYASLSAVFVELMPALVQTCPRR